jgi:uncharacterized protein YbcC (UPF0753/DUF2309 family)
MNNKNFDINHTLHELKHFLPSQMTLKDFIHHNSLHAFQDMKFYDGIFRASKLFGYKVTLQLQEYRKLFSLGRIKESVIERIIIDRKGADELGKWSNNILYKEYDENITARIGTYRSNWKKNYKIDIDSLVHPLLYRIIASYLDQGIGAWEFPVQDLSFLEAIRSIESNSVASFFKTNYAKQLLFDNSITIADLLNQLVGKEEDYETYLFDLSFSHRGWSGMVAVINDVPNTLLIEKKISLEEFIKFELLLEIDALVDHLGAHWKPLAQIAPNTSVDIFAATPITELDEVYMIWQDAFEWSYYDQVLASIKQNNTNTTNTSIASTFQAIFCIDERECSIRRHLEYVAPQCTTFGAPGFFGVEFYYKQYGAKFIDKLCPAPVTPKYLIKELGVHHHSSKDIFYAKSTYGLASGFLSTLTLGTLALKNLFQINFKPKMSASISDAFSHMNKDSQLTVENTDINEQEEGLQVGFTVEEMAIRVENFLRGIGLIKDFAKNIYVVAHGSSSANNPHHGAHDCGACSGRPGCVNARVFAIMANHPKVRAQLKELGIVIPNSTQFIAAMHDTASDLIGYYDDEQLNNENNLLHIEVKSAFENALDLNAKERSRRFSSINTSQPIKKIRKDIENRSVSLFEPRPELGHGTNSLAIIGRRSMTRGLFLDRRAFLNSYDYQTDLDGYYLAKVMAPIGIVCGGINLEYYFSRVDNVKLGCGTKLPHNVNGLIGVTNSSDGDLRPGLPWQMIEPHDPVRLLVIVEHYPEIVLKTIKSSDAMYEWYKNEWVHIAAMHPETKEFYYFKDEKMNQYHTNNFELKEIQNVHKLFEEAPEMINNHILNATFENLPIYQIENNL